MGMVVLASAASFHHQQHHHHDSLLSSSAAAEQNPIIPLLAAAPCLVDDDNVASRAKPGGMHLWQPVQFQSPHHLPPAHGAHPNPNPNTTLSNYFGKPVPVLDPSGILAGSAAGVGVSTCQDCGNQAKKDCSHRRCRTCCKSRGFDCSTHVKSTWVPAARRRERLTAATAGSSASTSAPKKPRLVSSQPATASHTSTSNTTPPQSFDTTSSHRDANVRESLPGHVQAPAVFKCVRVTSVDDDGEGEYAYHAEVKIGGRVFKGFLYDQGVDDGGLDDDARDAIPNMSELHLGNRNGGASSSSPMLPSDAFGGGGGGLMGGTSYGNQIN
ncbi:protein LATERAL ROOT PRIMORDIUM 1 [Canna indica]|uniref:Protein LATERAL ROOT PRIMORDIUM 1 n=1 Tax=Canna indica TaxID=4628 RepID=A0AAQ3Q4S6_9LILI|nr:protein LATERAL ROOT PRIMORDIUM 1 [Canna indica]